MQLQAPGNRDGLTDGCLEMKERPVALMERDGKTDSVRTTNIWMS